MPPGTHPDMQFQAAFLSAGISGKGSTEMSVGSGGCKRDSSHCMISDAVQAAAALSLAYVL
jgi:hypothetical protein